MKSIKRSLGNRIKLLRQQQGLTLEKLAFVSDLAKGNLSEIEKGQIDPKLTTLSKISEGLGISLKELVDF
ncbi:helix-turn-helix domain-containing protein [Candidatus Margulisiibacteriota bacterium]